MNLLLVFKIKKLIQALFGLVCVLVGAVWLKQSLQYIEIIINHNISIKDYVLLVIFLIPDLLVIVFPFCVLASILIVYNRMIANNELAIFRTCGLSNWTIAKPALFVGFFGMILVTILYVFIIPLSFQSFRNIEHKMRNEMSTSFLQEGNFNSLRGLTIYVKQKVDAKTLRGVFIYNSAPNSQDPSNFAYSIIAQEGKIVDSGQGFRLILQNGYRQEKNTQTNKVSTLKFDYLDYDLNQFARPESKRTVKPYELSIGDLIFPKDETLDDETRSKYKAEGHLRLCAPLIMLCYVFIGLNFVLRAPMSRVNSRKEIIGAILLSALVHFFIVFLINSNNKYPVFIPISYFTLLIIISLGWLFLAKFDRPIFGRH